MTNYICTITSNSTREREYDVATRSAYKAAAKYGRCEGGEIVRVYTKGGRLLSEARYTPEGGGHYYRCSI